MRLGLHTLAYAIMVLFREALADDVPELATTQVGAIRQRLLKVSARVTTIARRIWFHLSASWPTRALLVRVGVLAHRVPRILRRSLLLVREQVAGGDATFRAGFHNSETGCLGREVLLRRLATN